MVSSLLKQFICVSVTFKDSCVYMHKDTLLYIYFSKVYNIGYCFSHEVIMMYTLHAVMLGWGCRPMLLIHCTVNYILVPYMDFIVFTFIPL